ncbi:MAG: Gfo/Idh/MocA family oxidoreductase, partial [Atribacterota bacterium]|nr:Gfo/Idh/MocA family oxidoreductase [Atribacterota bacterium]
HPYEDYRRGYAARKDLGGGVTFGLIHELDLIQWLFGVPVEVFAVKGAPSKLEVDVEDTMMALFRCCSKTACYPVSLSLSYSQGLEQRRFCVLMQDGVLECDLQYGSLKVTRHNKGTVLVKEYKSIKRNDLFKSEMKHFLSCVIKREETNIPLSEGEKSLVMSLAVHKSLKTGKVVKI